MALTASTNITESQWSAKLFKEYVRATQFSSQMGTNENAAIQLVEDLTKMRGDNISVPMALKLSNTGITGYSATAWYLMADPADAPSFGIAYLNGREAPVIEEVDPGANYLGKAWRGYFDFGVCQIDSRGSVKSTGAD